MTTKALKPGPKKIATSTGKPDQRQPDNKETPSNTPSLKPLKSTTKKIELIHNYQHLKS